MIRLLRFLRNWAETDEPRDPELSDVVLPLPPGEALRRIETVVPSLPRWRVERADAAAGEAHLTHRTGGLGFVDDVRLRLEAVPGGTRLHGRSKSRIGLIDFGQNRRNLKELIAALRRAPSDAGRP